MSRIGKAVIQLPEKVEISVSKGNEVTVKGPRGTMVRQMDHDMIIEVKDGTLEVKRPTDQKRHRSLHGLTRSLISNMVEGVSTGFKKELELIGVGYRVSNTGNLLELTVGYSHPVYFYVPDDIKVETKSEKGKSPTIFLESSDKEMLGLVATKIRSFRKPEPYKGKGIRFVGEQIRRKAGKTAAK
ncbi:MAG: 50S ribosomal protein L6 [Saprospirales bacterium]|jgi:large subunit ribosomal protein L6|nr:MAG: 50S ribosomal protein L6 [Saprospirales bacterium]